MDSNQRITKKITTNKTEGDGRGGVQERSQPTKTAHELQVATVTTVQSYLLPYMYIVSLYMYVQ